MKRKQMRLRTDLCSSTLDSHRYLHRQRDEAQIRLRNSFSRCEEYLAANEDDFRRGFRVSHAQFSFIVEQIEPDELFHQGNMGRPMFPVRHQVLLVLWRLGHSGTGATLFQIGQRFGVGEGTVVLWTDRVLSALMSLERRFMWWPSPGERAQLRRELTNEHGLAGCIGFIDGSHINLAVAPARHDAADFFNRHHRHSFNLLAVVDRHLRFRFLHLGFPGSAHDQRVYRACALAQSPDSHFSTDEFILGDSGYTCDAHLVSLFRRFRGQESLDPDQVCFNRHASSRRVAVEHAFGVLKLRWQSLRALPVSLRSEVDEARAACWIRACVVLHNALRDQQADPGLWLTAIEREEAQRQYGEDFTRWEEHVSDDEDAVGLNEVEEEDERSVGQQLRSRVQIYASMWRQQRDA
ncbi:unnamed protein product [Tilletia laevis]|uniref:DDE Tnp4 domain-containing protein n=1 Tax=Tilletia laevis TaxID=157183 RepID=A0A9N8MFD1_9BASI|nr:unnamed protein product [Tilletia laevis]CAD6951515.1 unnamed protein product [Tilletia controversa]CAD6963047.1 unnamed protein product [Tilletia laevis]CAD6976612.1 unnamed protein product [Tilletia controversa]